MLRKRIKLTKITPVINSFVNRCVYHSSVLSLPQSQVVIANQDHLQRLYLKPCERNKQGGLVCQNSLQILDSFVKRYGQDSVLHITMHVFLICLLNL